MTNHEAEDRQYHYWIVARREGDGKPYLIYGAAHEDEARQKGLEMLSGLDFELRRFPTRNLAAASAFLRGKRLESGEGLRRSTQRIGHDRSLHRLRHKRQQQQGG